MVACMAPLEMSHTRNEDAASEGDRQDVLESGRGRSCCGFAKIPLITRTIARQTANQITRRSDFIKISLHFLGLLVW